MIELMIHGYGGQGAVTLAELLASAAMRMGKCVQTLPFFGVERRGAPVKASLRISDDPIRVRSQMHDPAFLVVMHENLLPLALANGVRPDCRILLNAEKTPECKYSLSAVAASEIATEEGLVADGVPYSNIPMLGFAAAEFGIPLSAVEETLKERWPGKVGEKNARVAAIGYRARVAEKGGEA